MQLSDSLYLSSRALHRRLGQIANEAFGEMGLSSSYAFLLMAVSKQPGIQPTELSNKLQLSPSTITRLVEKMEYRGYLERSPEGRSTLITLTDKGADLQPQLRRAWNKLETQYTAQLGERYHRVLTEMMQQAGEQMRAS